MSVVRSLVASTSALPAAASFSAVRRLSTQAAASTPLAVKYTSQTDKWLYGVPEAIQARLPPVHLAPAPPAPQDRPVKPPRAPVETPAKFVGVLGRGLVKKLKGKVDLEAMTWHEFMTFSGEDWMEKGALDTKDMRYLTRIINAYQTRDADPRALAVERKKPKKYRAWGPAVQNGIRIPGARFKLDLAHAPRPFGMPGFPFRGVKRE